MNNWFQTDNGDWLNLDQAIQVSSNPAAVVFEHGRHPLSADEFERVSAQIESGQTKKKKKKKKQPSEPLNPPGDGI